MIDEKVLEACAKANAMEYWRECYDAEMGEPLDWETAELYAEDNWRVFKRQTKAVLEALTHQGTGIKTGQIPIIPIPVEARLREVREAVEPCSAVDWALDEIDCNYNHHIGGSSCTHCLLKADKDSRIEALATLNEIIKELEKV